MSYKAMGSFRCDGCKVIQSDPVEIEADILRPIPPRGWLRVETSELQDDLDVRAVKHYCRLCAPLITSYLAGRREAPHAAD
jgi:hypothetical protein